MLETQVRTRPRNRGKSSALIYLGGTDSLVTVPTNQMFVYFEERVRSVHRLQVQPGDHMFAGCGEDVADQIVRWIHGQA